MAYPGPFQNPFTGCPQQPPNSRVPDGVCCKNGRSITCRDIQACDANGQDFLAPNIALEICNAGPNGVQIGGAGKCCNQLEVCPAPCVCPQKVDQLLRPQNWPQFGQNAFNTSAAAPCQTQINTCNLHLLVNGATVPVLPGGLPGAPTLADVQSNPTADDSYVYFTTQNQYNQPNPLLPPVQVGTGGYLVKVERATGNVVWRRLIQDYTGVTGDLSYSSPALWKQYILIATGLKAPQTLATPPGGFDFNANYVNAQNGPIFQRGQPVSLLWIDRVTGDLLHQRLIGDFAQTIYDDYNWSYVKASPVVAQICGGDGYRRTVVAVGLATSQDQLPWEYHLIGAIDPTAEEYWMGNNRNFRFSDVGHVFLFDVDDQTQILNKPMAPGAPSVSPDPALIEGPSFFAKGQETIAISVRAEFVRQELNSGITNYVATPQSTCPLLAEVQQIRYLLRAGAVAPLPIQNLQTYNNQGSLETIPAAPTPIPVSLDLTSITIDVQFNPVTGFFHTLALPGLLYDSQDANLLPDNAVLKKFYRNTNVRLPGDEVLVTSAYQASRFGYYGAGVDAVPAFNVSLCDGVARELYVATSNNQQVPLYEAEWIYGKLYTGPAPFPQNNFDLCTLPYLYRQALTAAASITSASQLPLPNAIPFLTALELKRRYVLRELARTLSLRGGYNRHNAVVVINLRPQNAFYSVLGQDTFGRVLKAQRVTAFSVYHHGFVVSALRAESTTGNTSNVINLPGWTSTQEFYFTYRGADSGFGAGPLVLKDVQLNDYVPSEGYTYCDVCQQQHSWRQGDCLARQTYLSEIVQVPVFVPPPEVEHNYIEVTGDCSSAACCRGANGQKVCCGVRPANATCCPKQEKKCLGGYYQCTQARQPLYLRDDLIVAATRGGEVLVIQLKDTRVEQSYSNYVLRHYLYVGNPGTIGGADHGISSDYCKGYSLQANAGSIPDFNRFPVTSAPPNFIITNNEFLGGAWWSKLDLNSFIPLGQSYLCAGDVVTGEPVWQSIVNSGGDFVNPLISSAAVGNTYLHPCSRNLVFLVGADRQVHFFDAIDGRDLRVLANANAAGPAKPILVDREVWVASGLFTNVPNNDAPTPSLLQYRLSI